MFKFFSQIRLLWVTLAVALTASVSIVEAFHLAEDAVSDKTMLQTFALWYLVGIITLIIGVAGWRIFVTIKKEKYANVTVHIHATIHGIRDLLTYMDQNIEAATANAASFEPFRQNFRHRMVDILSSISQLFSMVTGTTCRACIKTTFRHENGVYMQTLARDKRSDTLHFNRDERRRDEFMDPISRNSEFLRMCELEVDGPGQWHFLCNNIKGKGNPPVSDHQASMLMTLATRTLVFLTAAPFAVRLAKPLDRVLPELQTHSANQRLC